MTITVAMTWGDLLTLIGQLPRCPYSTSGQGQQKKIFPVQALAYAYAGHDPARLVYHCRKGAHWHVATVRDKHGPSRRPGTPAAWHALIADALANYDVQGRQRVYGARTSTGKWIYRTHPALFRDQETRTYGVWPQ